MDLLEDTIDLNTFSAHGADPRAANAALMAATAAAVSTGRDVRCRPPLPAFAPSASKQCGDAAILQPPPSPQQSGGGGGSLMVSPLSGRISGEQLPNGAAERTNALSLDLGSLHQALLQSGSLNGQQAPSIPLRLLMQVYAATVAAAQPPTHSIPRSSSGGASSGSDRLLSVSAHNGFQEPTRGNGLMTASLVNGPMPLKGAGGGSGMYDCTAPGMFEGPMHHGSRGFVGSNELESYTSQPARRGSGGVVAAGRGGGLGIGADTAAAASAASSAGAGKGLPSVGVTVTTVDLLKALLAAHGGLSGGGMGSGNCSGSGIGLTGSTSDLSAFTSAQLHSLLQQVGAGGGGGSSGVILSNGTHGVLVGGHGNGGGGSGSSLLSGLRGGSGNSGASGLSATAGPLSGLLTHLAASNGFDTSAAGAGTGASLAAAILRPNSAAAGPGNGLDALAGLLQSEFGTNTGAGRVSGGSVGGGSLGPQLAALLQQSHQHGAPPEALSKSALLSSLLNVLPLSSRALSNSAAVGSSGASGFSGGGDGNGGHGVHGGVNLKHLLAAAFGGGGGRLAVGGTKGRLEDCDAHATTAPAVASTSAAVTAAPRDPGGGGGSGSASATASASGRGSGGSGSGNRPHRHSNSDLCGGNGLVSSTSSKGPTGFQLLKNLVTSGAAGVGVAGLMNGSGGLADLAELSGGVATQLMEDLESLGCPAGMLSRHGGRASSGVGAAGPSNRSCDGSAAASRLGSAGAPSGAPKGRFISAEPSSPGSKKANKRPENGSLASQILKRQRQSLVMPQPTYCGDTASGIRGPAVHLPTISLPPSAPPIATSKTSLGSGGVGLGGSVGTATAPESLPAAAATSTLPPMAVTATLVATHHGGGGSGAALTNGFLDSWTRNNGITSSAAACTLPSGVTTTNNGAAGRYSACGDVEHGGLTAAGRQNDKGCTHSGASSASHRAQLPALALYGLPGSSSGGLLAPSSLLKAHCLGASLVLGQLVPKGRRSRRSARATGPKKMRNIMKILGFQITKRAQPDEAEQHERNSLGGGSSGGSSDVGHDARSLPPPIRRQRGNGAAAAAASLTVSAAAATAAPPAPRSLPGSGPVMGRDHSAADGGGVGSSSAAGPLGGVVSIAALPWDLMTQSTEAGIPLAARMAKYLGLPSGTELMSAGNGSGVVAAILAAAAAARAAAAAAAAAAPSNAAIAPFKAPAVLMKAGAVNESTGGGSTVGVSSRQQTTAPPSRSASTGPANGQGAKAGSAAKAAAVTAAAAAATVAAAAATAAAASMPTSKSRRKGGAPTRAAD